MLSYNYQLISPPKSKASFYKYFLSLKQKLLERDPSKRLGSGPLGSAEIKAHDWFNDIDWASVSQRSLKPPKPKKKIKISKKNIPKDLLIPAKGGKEISGWTFIES